MPRRTFKQLKGLLYAIKNGEFEGLPPFFRSKAFTVVVLLFLSLFIALLATMSLQRIPSHLVEGMVAPRDIKADKNYEIVDQEATEKSRRDAMASVQPVFDYDEYLVKSVIERVRVAFANARIRYNSLVGSKAAAAKAAKSILGEKDGKELKEVFSDSLGVVPQPQQWDFLLKDGFSAASENLIVGVLSRALDGPVVAEKGPIEDAGEKGVILRRNIGTDESGEEVLEESVWKDTSGIRSIGETKEGILRRQALISRGRDNSYLDNLSPLIQELVVPNCTFDRQQTERRRDEAALGVKSSILKIKSGEMIIREGARYEPWHIKVLNGIKLEKSRRIYQIDFLGTFLLIFLLISIPFYLAEKLFEQAKTKSVDHILMVLVATALFLVIKVEMMLAPTLQNAFFFGVPVSTLYYAFPVAAGAMLLRMYLGVEITAVFSIVMSVILGLMVDGDVDYVAFCIVTNLAAVVAITRVDKRSAIFKAGVIVGVVGMASILGSSLIDSASAAEPVVVSEILWSMLVAFVGGIGSSIFTMIAMTLIESISGYTSDIKLLELANLNHPLLRELIVRAPGTYHHSHLVGVLGEAAAEAVHANALLVRVGAYYHDIGKMRKPQYFIENMKPGDNRHEKISPNMSALVVAAHVKDGVEMGKAAGIPKRIIDMMPEHHGTRIMNFFYNRAKEQADPEMGKVDDKDFRYPGPKPQSREAAILMLADVTEAAVRSLKEKTTVRIQQTVEKVINDIFAESQLDECDLTLKDLNEIAKAFMRILLGIYHQRIEYPKDVENDKSEISIIDESSTREVVGEERLPAGETKH
jgi:putative nucleotidyltransferase with HDIG domain